MKKVLVVILSIMMVMLSVPEVTFALNDSDSGGNNSGGEIVLSSDAEYDGYIVKVDESELERGDISNDMECITENVYKINDRKKVEALVNEGKVEYAEPDYIVTLEPYGETECAVSETEEITGRAYANRKNSGNLTVRLSDETENDEETVTTGWPYEKMNVEYAKSAGLTGEGVKIAVVDSGVDLSNYNLQGANIEAGYDYVEDVAGVTTDERYHGTYVIEMIAGQGKKLGPLGISKDADIVPLKCFNESGSTSFSKLSAAIYDAVDVYDCDIINMSWAFKNDSQVVEEAIEYAYQEGVILVAASGNVGSFSQGDILYPAAYDEVIGVGNVDSNLVVSEKSIQSEAVFICAPGKDIVFFKGNEESGKSIQTSGTSFASPAAAAAIALIKQAAPGICDAELRELLMERCVHLGEEGYNIQYGYGFVDVNNILKSDWLSFEDYDYHVNLQGWIGDDEEHQVVIAYYLNNGRMYSCRYINPVEGCVVVDEDYLKKDTSDKIKVFYLDENAAPFNGREPVEFLFNPVE